MNFADVVTARAQERASSLCAGFDPILERIPTCFVKLGETERSNEDALSRILTEHGCFALQTLAPYVAAIKPNCAFFEQYGIGGMRALRSIVAKSRELSVPVIMDAKRGDIGSTGEAYASAFLNPHLFRQARVDDFVADALTVNPFLGFETVEVFCKAARDTGRGLFILVKTSNPGSSDFQASGAPSLSEKLAEWINHHADTLRGQSGLSALGAVIGATHSTELSKFRALLPTSLLLIPGVGVQGGAADQLGGAFIGGAHRGALINVSRGVFAAHKDLNAPREILAQELKDAALKFVKDLAVSQGVQQDNGIS